MADSSQTNLAAGSTWPRRFEGSSRALMAGRDTSVDHVRRQSAVHFLCRRQSVIHGFHKRLAHEVARNFVTATRCARYTTRLVAACRPKSRPDRRQSPSTARQASEIAGASRLESARRRALLPGRRCRSTAGSTCIDGAFAEPLKRRAPASAGLASSQNGRPSKFHFDGTLLGRPFGLAERGALRVTSPLFAPPAKRSVTIAGHETSVSLEPVYWTALEAASTACGLPLTP